QATVNAKAASGMAMTRPPVTLLRAEEFTRPVAAPTPVMQPLPTVRTADSIRSRIIVQSGGTLAESVKLRSTLVQLNAHADFKASIQATPAAAGLKVPDAASIDAQKLVVKANAGLTVNQRLNLDRMLVQELPIVPIKGTSESWGLSFRYCVVNMSRNWLNTT